jgi:hypothetical protein
MEQGDFNKIATQVEGSNIQEKKENSLTIPQKND